MKIETLLHEEIQDEFKNLKEMELGTEEYKTTVDGLAKLVDRAIEIDKLNIDAQDKIDSREIEVDLKQQQINDENQDRKIRNGIAIAGIVIPTIVTIWGTLKSFKFEKDGTVTTIMGRGFIQKLLPNK